jgi:hypothetical protein
MPMLRPCKFSRIGMLARRARWDQYDAAGFEAGALEVWLCENSGAMRLYAAGSSNEVPRSAFFPAFPTQIEPR